MRAAGKPLKAIASTNKYGCLFLVIWNLLVAAAIVTAALTWNLSGRTTITVAIVGYVVGGLYGGVKILSLLTGFTGRGKSD